MFICTFLCYIVCLFLKGRFTIMIKLYYYKAFRNTAFLFVPVLASLQAMV